MNNGKGKMKKYALITMIGKFLITLGLVSALDVAATQVTVPTSPFTLTKNDVLEIRFTLPSSLPPNYDVLSLTTSAPTDGLPLYPVSELYNGTTLLGTYDGARFNSYWVSATSLYTFSDPTVIDYSSTTDGTMDGVIKIYFNDSATQYVTIHSLSAGYSTGENGYGSSTQYTPIITSIKVVPKEANYIVDINNLACDDTVGTPYCSISAALFKSIDKEIIAVNSGIYFENLNFNNKDVLLRSTNGPESTEINGVGSTTVIIGPNGQINGFKITGGLDSFGAGMDVIGTGAIIKSNIFDGNTQTAGGYGAAIGGNSASATIEGNIFRNNSCDSQFLSGTISFINGSSPLIVNNLFIGNTCRGINMTLPTSGRPEIYNNTFVENPAGIYFDRSISIANHRYINNIVYNNTIGIEVNFGTETNNPFFQNNIVFGNTTDYSGINNQTGINGNISLNPMFADTTINDFRLLQGSPAIDAGFAQQLIETDFLSNARVADGNDDMIAVVDIGAYESYPPVASAGDDFSVVSSTNVSLNATASIDADGANLNFSWIQSAGTSVMLLNDDTSTPSFTAPANESVLTFHVTVMDDQGFVSMDEISILVTATPMDPETETPTDSPSKGYGSIGHLFLLGLLILLITSNEYKSKKLKEAPGAVK